jgi:hypothetical protein
LIIGYCSLAVPTANDSITNNSITNTPVQTNRDYYNGRLRASPHEVSEFDAAACHLTITYGRPSKKGRVIWGGLVPWDRWWMPGADEATILTTTRRITLGGLEIPAGEHSIYFWPAEAAAQFIINNETGQFHTVYHAAQDLGRVNATMTKRLEPVEQMTFEVSPRPDGGTLKLAWDDREYAVPFVVGKGE